MRDMLVDAIEGATVVARLDGASWHLTVMTASRVAWTGSVFVHLVGGKDMWVCVTDVVGFLDRREVAIPQEPTGSVRLASPLATPRRI